MRRRLAWIQGGDVGQAFHILFEGPNGYYVGGTSETPQLVAPYFDAGASEVIQLVGITTIGPGNWIASGFVNEFSPALLFYGPSGRIARWNIADSSQPGTGAGHFQVGRRGTPNIRAYWATPTNSGFQNETGSLEYALPNVLVDGGFSQPNLDYSYAIYKGGASTYLVSAGGDITELSEPLLTSSIEFNRTGGDLLGLTFYEQGTAFDQRTNFTQGENSLTITPHAIATDGTVTTGTPFNISFIGPSPANYRSLNASYWQG
jgi:hypothetical protein